MLLPAVYVGMAAQKILLKKTFCQKYSNGIAFSRPFTDIIMSNDVSECSFSVQLELSVAFDTIDLSIVMKRPKYVLVWLVRRH